MWHENLTGFDADTLRLLGIARDLLARHFGHTLEDADEMMNAFFSRFSNRFDEDFYHHYGAYHTAALLHFVMTLAGKPEDFSRWLVDSGHSKTPEDALEYFRLQYFDRT